MQPCSLDVSMLRSGKVWQALGRLFQTLSQGQEFLSDVFASNCQGTYYLVNKNEFRVASILHTEMISPNSTFIFFFDILLATEKKIKKSKKKANWKKKEIQEKINLLKFWRTSNIDRTIDEQSQNQQMLKKGFSWIIRNIEFGKEVHDFYRNELKNWKKSF